jgi:hypothetical protein
MEVKKKKVLILYCLGFMAFFSGVIDQYFSISDMLLSFNLIIMIGAGLLSFIWYRYDSDEISYKRKPLLNVGIVGFGILVFPYYFFRTRGFIRGLAATLLFLLLVITWTVLQYGGALVVYHGLQS